jgi:hypothetical protein
MYLYINYIHFQMNFDHVYSEYNRMADNNSCNSYSNKDLQDKFSFFNMNL